jgi:hypothetical protein
VGGSRNRLAARRLNSWLPGLIVIDSPGGSPYDFGSCTQVVRLARSHGQCRAIFCSSKLPTNEPSGSMRGCPGAHTEAHIARAPSWSSNGRTALRRNKKIGAGRSPPQIFDHCYNLIVVEVLVVADAAATRFRRAVAVELRLRAGGHGE